MVDGEILVWNVEQGRCSFSLLQRRLTAGRRLAEIVRANPAHLVAFDLLRDGRGRELLDQPLAVRRAKLERLLRGAPAQIAICPQTDSHDVTRGWLEELGVAGVEGVFCVTPAKHTRSNRTTGGTSTPSFRVEIHYDVRTGRATFKAEISGHAIEQLVRQVRRAEAAHPRPPARPVHRSANRGSQMIKGGSLGECPRQGTQSIRDNI